MAFQNIESPLSDNEISEMKSNVRIMTRKRDSLAIEVAKILNLPNVWTLDNVDWSNPEVHDLGEQIFQYDCEINRLNWEISRQIAIRDGELDYYNAKVKAHQFIADNFDDFEDQVQFYKKNGLEMGMSSLTDKIYHNPHYLEEVIM